MFIKNKHVKLTHVRWVGGMAIICHLKIYILIYINFLSNVLSTGIFLWTLRQMTALSRNNFLLKPPHLINVQNLLIIKFTQISSLKQFLLHQSIHLTIKVKTNLRKDAGVLLKYLQFVNVKNYFYILV